jgi:arylsulfatase A
MAARRPNIVLILADDMGYGDFGAFGDGSPQTPAIDGLIAAGTCLTQHYAGSPVCAPSRAALLSGRYAHRTGAVDTLEARGLDRLALRERTIADRFRAAGYATGLVGKWHLGAIDPAYHPTARGWDEFVGFRGGWSDYYDWRLDWGGAVRRGDGRYLTDVLTDAACDFIRRHRARPFLLHVAYNAPHFPFQAPEPDIEHFRALGRLNTGLCVLYAMIRRMDQGVDRILETLGRAGLREDTLVLFTSDNGPQLSGEGDLSIRRFNAWLSGQKGTVFEGGIRVPAVVRWPAGLPPGPRRSHAFVHMVDWVPTLLEAAGLGNGTAARESLPLDGRSVLGVLRGEPAGAPPPRFWQWNRYTPVGASNAAVRDGDWKLLRPAIAEAMRLSPEDAAMDRRIKAEPEGFADIWRGPEPARLVPPPPAPQLYNIAEDPYERCDLAGAQPERAARLLRALESWFEEVDAERRRIGNGG